MNPAGKTKEVGRKKGDFLDRFTKLQRTVMPLARRTVRTARVEKFKTVEDLNRGRVHQTSRKK
jgi:hypothetical protein